MSQLVRERWGSKFGFVAASIGAAVGLANIWMFPWRVGQYGAAFLIPFFIFLFVGGLVGLMVEWGLGRCMDGGPIIAFQKARFPGGKYLGSLPSIIAVMVLAFYCIIIGWALKFLVGSFTGAALTGAPGQFFGSVAFQPEARLWFVITIILTVLVVSLGVRRGIETAAKVLMPLLFLMLIIMAVWGLTLPGAFEGLKFYMFPEFSSLLSGEIWLVALAQAIFSLSLGGGAMIVVGSYLNRDADLPVSSVAVGFGDVLVAIIAGFAIFPAVFAFNIDPAAGPGLAFFSLPALFMSMPGGQIFSIMFFACLFFAGFSSVVIIFEVVVDSATTHLKLSRFSSAAIFGLVVIALGLPAATNEQYFGNLITISTVYLLLIAGIVAAIAFTWTFDVRKAREHINLGAEYKMGTWWEPWAKYVYPLILIVVLILGILGVAE